MALFIPGMRCAISGRPIASAAEVVAFPPFIANEADPLHIFSDAVVHKDVFEKHPLAVRVQDRLAEARRQTAPGNRQCLICSELVTDPKSYLGLGHLIDDPLHPLYQFNYAHFHRSHLANWPRRPALLSELDELNRSGAWQGEVLGRLIAMIRLL